MNNNAEKIDVIGAIELAAIDAANAAQRHKDLGQNVAAGVTSLQALELHKVGGLVVDLLALAAKMAAHVRPTCTELYGEATALLARVGAGS